MTDYPTIRQAEMDKIDPLKVLLLKHLEGPQKKRASLPSFMTTQILIDPDELLVFFCFIQNPLHPCNEVLNLERLDNKIIHVHQFKIILHLAVGC